MYSDKQYRASRTYKAARRRALSIQIGRISFLMTLFIFCCVLLTVGQ